MTYPNSGEVQVGTILRETYEITALIGYGGMGSVYVARHLRLPGKQVAVKVLHAGSGLSQEIYARFRREAEIASRLGHPNIVEVVDYHTLPSGTPFLVLEYLRGESLAQRLRRGPMSWEDTKGMTRQMGSALRAAHRAGVVHRDLKPDNVFLVPSETGGVVSERVKLLDFGISKIADSTTVKTVDAILMGTPLYMSPEQALGKNSEVDPRTDQFALGSILYEVLSGRSPFAGENIPQIIYRIVHEEPEPLGSQVPSLPPKALAAIEKAMAKKVGDRFPDIGSFVAELTGSPLQTLSDPSIPPAGPSTQSEKTEEGEIEPTFISQNQPRPPSQPPLGPAAPAPPSAPATRAPWIAIGVLLAGGVAAGYFLVNARTKTTSYDAGLAVALAPTLKAGHVENGSPSLDAGLAVHELADAGAVAALNTSHETTTAVAGGDGKGGLGKHRPPPRPQMEALPVSVRDSVEAAETALRNGEPQQVIDTVDRLERNSEFQGLPQRSRSQVRGFSMYLRSCAYCAKRDYGMQRSAFEDVPGAWRPAALAYCNRFGMLTK